MQLKLLMQKNTFIKPNIKPNEMTLEEIIKQSENKEVLELLSKNKVDEVLTKIKKSFPSTSKKILQAIFVPSDEIKDVSLALNVLYSILNFEGDLDYIFEKHTPENSTETLPQMSELIRCLYILDTLKNREKETLLLAKYILHFLRESSFFVAKNSNNYPEGSISGEIWILGAGIRVKADEMADFFILKKDDYREMSARFYKVKVTTHIMNHYPHLVGPDMIALANKYENMENTNDALSGYKAVHADFQDFLLNIEYEKEEAEAENEIFKLNEDDILVLNSLIKACEGLIRLGQKIDKSLITRSEELIKNSI